MSTCISERVLKEMGRRYSGIGPIAIMTWSREKNGIPSLAYLSSMVNECKVNINFLDPHGVQTVVTTGKWQKEGDHLIQARFPNGTAFKDAYSRSVLATGGLKSIKLAYVNPLNDLMTDNQDLQIDLANKLISECCTQKVAKVASECGLTIDAALDVGIKELPGIRFDFALNEDQTRICSLLLDAWSGSVFLDNETPSSYLPHFFSNGQQVQDMLVHTVDVCRRRINA